MEKQSPEILAYKERMVNEMDEFIVSQEDVLNKADEDAEKIRIPLTGQKANISNLFKSYYKLEIERMKYLLKSYLRTRLIKIQNNYLDIIKNEKGDLLSNAEYEFAANFFVHKKTHFIQSFAGKFPTILSDFVDLDPERPESAEHPNCPVNPEMISKPNLSTPVFVKITKNVGKLGHHEAGLSMNLKCGDIIFMSYERSKDLIASDVAELT